MRYKIVQKLKKRKENESVDKESDKGKGVDRRA